MFEFLDFQVRDVMSDPVCITPETSLADAERLLEERGFNAVPVVSSDGELLGIVSSLDVLGAFRFDDESTLPNYDAIMRRPVERIMTSTPLTVTPRAPLTRILEKMIATRNRSFPVLDDSRVVGVISRRDVMRALRQAAAGRKPAVEA
jgi:CBS domain-containing protein